MSEGEIKPMSTVIRADISGKLITMRGAYIHLRDGAQMLLEGPTLFWTERLLLRLVWRVYGQRLEEIDAALTAVSQEKG